MGTDHIEWFLGAVGFPSVEGGEFGDQAAAVARIPAPKNGVNSRDIKLHALRYQRSQLADAGRYMDHENATIVRASELLVHVPKLACARESTATLMLRNIRECIKKMICTWSRFVSPAEL